MAYKPFKMKGNPMKRNYGVGKSPNKMGAAMDPSMMGAANPETDMTKLQSQNMMSTGMGSSPMMTHRPGHAGTKPAASGNVGREKAPKPDSSAMKNVSEYLKSKVDSSKTKVEKKDGKTVKTYYDKDGIKVGSHTSMEKPSPAKAYTNIGLKTMLSPIVKKAKIRKEVVSKSKAEMKEGGKTRAQHKGLKRGGRLQAKAEKKYARQDKREARADAKMQKKQDKKVWDATAKAQWRTEYRKKNQHRGPIDRSLYPWT